MSTFVQERLFYSTYAGAIAPDGTNNFTRLLGVQSIGITTRYNLLHIFELGQLNEYQAIEGTAPDVEVTMEKVIDGSSTPYMYATQQGSDASLVGRSSVKFLLAVSYFGDTQQSASGVPINQVTMSGLFPSSLTYTFPVQGPFTESMTSVGNEKNWTSTIPFTFSGGYLDTDVPPSGVQVRQNFQLGSGMGNSVLPTNIPGVTGQGYLIADAGGFFTPRLQNVRTSVNLGRTNLYELGVFIPYFRTVDFPVEVRTDIEALCMAGDLAPANINGNNITNNQITIVVQDGLTLNLGALNRCVSVSETGGNAQQGGGNRSMTFSYVNFNSLKVSAPYDVGQLS